jgi:glucose-6-phosphate 1-epimerase
MISAPSQDLPTASRIDHQGQAAIELALPNGSRAIVMLHGAHVVSWQDAAWGEQLYLSPLSRMETGKAIRGGVPVIFPQFEERGPDFDVPRHGFARTTAWQLDDLRATDDQALCTLMLADNDTTQALWPHRFSLELTVALSANRLDMELHVVNTDAHAWAFSAALHTYLGISQLTQVRLQGLDGCRFTDAKSTASSTESDVEKRFAGHIDRIYTQAPRSVLLRDGARLLNIEADAFEDAVVWNPGPALCAGMSDMPSAGWEHMLCVEAAQINQPPVLQPSESWTGRQSLILTTKPAMS